MTAEVMATLEGKRYISVPFNDELARIFDAWVKAFLCNEEQVHATFEHDKAQRIATIYNELSESR